MNDIKVVAIDFDDTLCLTEEVCYGIENFVAAKLGFSPQSREVHLRTWGQTIEGSANERFPGIDIPKYKALLASTLPEFVERGEFDQITEENYQVLDEIKAMGKKLVVLTSRSEGEVRHLIDPNHPLSLKVDAFYHKDNTGFLKPDPRVFSNMLSKFNVSPEEAVYIGDSLSDVKSANAAGLISIVSLESGLRKKADFVDVQVDYFIQRFSEVIKILA